MRGFMSVAKALSDESRVRVLMALRGRELCVCQIITFLGLAPSTVSKHIAILWHAQLVESRKQGRWMFYRLNEDDGAPAPVRDAFVWLESALSKDPVTRDDAVRLEAILERNPEELCKELGRS